MQKARSSRPGFLFSRACFIRESSMKPRTDAQTRSNRCRQTAFPHPHRETRNLLRRLRQPAAERFEAVELTQERVDGRKLDVGQVILLEQGMQPFAPIIDAHDRLLEVARERRRHHARDVRDFLFNECHGAPRMVNS
ncbi:MAG: hypothetical protein LBV73_01975, partial [Paraburkholderia sp.]|nr:hypothetical protein [Paraburkholderia sp.]